MGFRVYVMGFGGNIGIMGKNMGKTGMGLGFRVMVYWDPKAGMERNMETTIKGYVGIMDKKMETTI